MEVNFMLWLEPNTHSRARLHCTVHKNNLSWLGYVAKSFNHREVLFIWAVFHIPLDIS